MTAKQVIKAKEKAKIATKNAPKWHFPLEKKNFYVIGIGIGVIILGYLLMATGIGNQPAIPHGRWDNIWSVNIAPIVLVIGYCIIIPYGIFKRFNTTTHE